MNIKDKIKLYEENIINSSKKTIYKKTDVNKSNVRKKIYDWNNINKSENNINKSENNINKIQNESVKPESVKPESVKPIVSKKNKKKGLNNNIDDDEDIENSVINM